MEEQSFFLRVVSVANVDTLYRNNFVKGV